MFRKRVLNKLIESYKQEASKLEDYVKKTRKSILEAEEDEDYILLESETESLVTLKKRLSKAKQKVKTLEEIYREV